MLFSWNTKLHLPKESGGRKGKEEEDIRQISMPGKIRVKQNPDLKGKALCSSDSKGITASMKRVCKYGNPVIRSPELAACLTFSRSRL
jgi:hypothetical protein